jgi:hypothetical protein
MFSPCIFDTVLKTYASPCENERYPLCGKDVREHALFWLRKEHKTLLPIGLAKDGRIIYGPYK